MRPSARPPLVRRVAGITGGAKLFLRWGVVRSRSRCLRPVERATEDGDEAEGALRAARRTWSAPSARGLRLRGCHGEEENASLMH